MKYAPFATLACVLLACDRHPSSGAAAPTNVPAYLQPIFASLDSLLPGARRDSLRSLSLDSGFLYRTRDLADATPLQGAWMRSPIVDTIIARGEKAYMTPAIIVDLYQQHLRGEMLDVAASVRRVSPEYVETILHHAVSVDSVLLRQDLDGSNVRDQLVREVRRRPIEVDEDPSGSSVVVDTVVYSEYRLALYLDAAPLTVPLPAWAVDFDNIDDAQLVRVIPLAVGGTLLVFDIVGADAEESVIVLAWQGTAREVLHHQIDYGNGSFALRDADGRIAVDITGDVQLGERQVSSDIQCPQTAWPGSMLVYDESARNFVVQRAICVPRRRGA